MEDQVWMDELNMICREDSLYQHWLARAEELEPAFELLRGVLSEGQRETLDQYIMACEELDHVRKVLAYQLGRRSF